MVDGYGEGSEWNGMGISSISTILEQAYTGDIEQRIRCAVTVTRVEMYGEGETAGRAVSTIERRRNTGVDLSIVFPPDCPTT